LVSLPLPRRLPRTDQSSRTGSRGTFLENPESALGAERLMRGRRFACTCPQGQGTNECVHLPTVLLDRKPFDGFVESCATDGVPEFWVRVEGDKGGPQWSAPIFRGHEPCCHSMLEVFRNITRGRRYYRSPGSEIFGQTCREAGGTFARLSAKNDKHICGLHQRCFLRRLQPSGHRDDLTQHGVPFTHLPNSVVRQAAPDHSNSCITNRYPPTMCIPDAT